MKKVFALLLVSNMLVACSNNSINRVTPVSNTVSVKQTKTPGVIDVNFNSISFKGSSVMFNYTVKRFNRVITKQITVEQPQGEEPSFKSIVVDGREIPLKSFHPEAAAELLKEVVEVSRLVVAKYQTQTSLQSVESVGSNATATIGAIILVAIALPCLTYVAFRDLLGSAFNKFLNPVDPNQYIKCFVW
jgi:hypothetical protein